MQCDSVVLDNFSQEAIGDLADERALGKENLPVPFEASEPIDLPFAVLLILPNVGDQILQPAQHAGNHGPRCAPGCQPARFGPLLEFEHCEQGGLDYIKQLEMRQCLASLPDE